LKIVVINGNEHHGSTWNSVQLFIEKVSQLSKHEVTEFFLPKDMPNFCIGCFSCFLNGEHTCPHAVSVTPIIKAIEECDLIILSSPVYGFDVTGQMKALLDHLCFMWLSHRPNPKMFNKVGLIVCTTAGAGLYHTSKTLKNSLKFWGVKRIYTYKKAVAALKWNDVSKKNKDDIDKAINIMALKVISTVNGINKLSTPFFTKFMFNLMKVMMKKNNWNQTDRKHWESLGWLKGNKPF